MPFPTGSGSKSEVDQQLKNKRQQIIEEERIRVLSESFMNFYDKLMDSYELVRLNEEEVETDLDSVRESVSRDEVGRLARDYAETKPLGY